MRPARLVPSRMGAALVVVGCAAVAFRCAVYDRTLLLASKADGGPPPETGADTGTNADTCAHQRWPPRPETDDGTALNRYTVAMNGLSFTPDGGTPIGYDLDGVCTCPGPESCKPPHTSKKPNCDNDGGIDNGGGELAESFSGFSDAFASEKVQAHLRNGDYSLLFRIIDYNGGVNDTQVSFAVYISDGTVGVETEAGTPTKPLFDGNDRWTIDTGSLVGGSAITGQDCDDSPSPCVPLFIDPRAYVTNRILVATVDFPIVLGAGANAGSVLVVDLVGSVVTGTLIPEGASFRIEDGQINGRWPTTKLLTSLSTVNDPIGKGALCGDNATYLNVKSLICEGADISGDLKQDNTGAPCDALSTAMAYTATPAKLGPVYGKKVVPSPCGATYSDSCP